MLCKSCSTAISNRRHNSDIPRAHEGEDIVVEFDARRIAITDVAIAHNKISTGGLEEKVVIARSAERVACERLAERVFRTNCKLFAVGHFRFRSATSRTMSEAIWQCSSVYRSLK